MFFLSGAPRIEPRVAGLEAPFLLLLHGEQELLEVWLRQIQVNRVGCFDSYK